ncbi:hypothetical protein K493DRAFT_363113 [Basidiobolus meristosporus CBS 931.73]|uniref:Uncharacterized protein n=1 Tax=Basidiobolus meristosporus CBS 931.73 TaxID=1314790 RepID=A0A1Y1WX78_9FUNG|nr:hypothetical protein K493DRAFT_363113 [Basidiobolus meristosporus CBS 931.73]|eukprot:ORX78052.1 hypothetical protein K493DRAFT_363113 [Basidiobolus meristosporus CBS 931.73]
MQLSLLLLVSAIASLQAISASPLGDSQVAFTNEPCVEQQDACYQNTSAPSQEYQPSTEEGDDSEMSEPMQTSESSGEQPGFSGLQGFDISNLQPSQALLDDINGHSSSKANALSNSNQFDQAQVIDQTLYQPKQQQSQIIITQPAARALRGGYKKYKRSARRHFKVFTTVTRKHDNLNIANANSNKGFNVKYQAGPSLELEGGAKALEYAKQKGAEHSDDSSFSPYVLMQPTQDRLRPERSALDHSATSPAYFCSPKERQIAQRDQYLSRQQKTARTQTSSVGLISKKTARIFAAVTKVTAGEDGSEHQTCTKDSDCVFDNTNCAKNF